MFNRLIVLEFFFHKFYNEIDTTPCIRFRFEYICQLLNTWRWRRTETSETNLRLNIYFAILRKTKIHYHVQLIGPKKVMILHRHIWIASNRFSMLKFTVQRSANELIIHSFVTRKEILKKKTIEETHTALWPDLISPVSKKVKSLNHYLLVILWSHASYVQIRINSHVISHLFIVFYSAILHWKSSWNATTTTTLKSNWLTVGYIFL